MMGMSFMPYSSMSLMHYINWSTGVVNHKSKSFNAIEVLKQPIKEIYQINICFKTSIQSHLSHGSKATNVLVLLFYLSYRHRQVPLTLPDITLW